MDQSKAVEMTSARIGWRFGASFAGWGFGLLALSRWAWVERNLLEPFATVQQRLAGVLAGPPAGAVLVDASCSGADVLALCTAAILAYPASWSARFRGAGCVVGALVGLNIVRLGTVSLAAGHPAVFRLLHVQVWPALLVLAAVGLVMLWIRGRDVTHGGSISVPARRLLAWAGVLVAAYFVVVGRLQEAAVVQGATHWVAVTAGKLLGLTGMAVTVTGSVVRTAHGSFLVTPGCVVSPLIPVYMAATIATTSRLAHRIVGLVAAVPVFFGLGVVRLLVLALPGSLLAAPAVAIHAFHQVLVAAALVVGTALWWGRRRGGWLHGAHRTLVALGVGVATALVVVSAWNATVVGSVGALQAIAGHAGHAYADVQGAFGMIPGFQLVLFVGLCVGLREAGTTRRLGLGLLALGVLQVGVTLIGRELSHHVGFAPHVGLVRAWGVLVPAMLVGTVVWPSLADALAAAGGEGQVRSLPRTASVVGASEQG